MGFFKRILKGIEYILFTPFWVLILTGSFIYSVLLFIIYPVKAMTMSFSGINMFKEIPEDIEARRRLHPEQFKEKKPDEISQETKTEETKHDEPQDTKTYFNPYSSYSPSFDVSNEPVKTDEVKIEPEVKEETPLIPEVKEESVSIEQYDEQITETPVHEDEVRKEQEELKKEEPFIPRAKRNDSRDFVMEKEDEDNEGVSVFFDEKDMRK